MKHVRWLPPDAWPQVPVDPEDPDAGERDATERELLQMDLALLGEHPEGGWIVDCLGREGRDYPGWRVSKAGGIRRFHAVSRDVMEVCWHCTVHRSGDGSDLRSAVATDLGTSTTGPDRLPAGTGRLGVEHPVPDSEDAVARARARDESRRVRVPVREVTDRDVVEAGPRPGHRWAGDVKVSP